MAHVYVAMEGRAYARLTITPDLIRFSVVPGPWLTVYSNTNHGLCRDLCFPRSYNPVRKPTGTCYLTNIRELSCKTDSVHRFLHIPLFLT